MPRRHYRQLDQRSADQPWDADAILGGSWIPIGAEPIPDCRRDAKRDSAEIARSCNDVKLASTWRRATDDLSSTLVGISQSIRPRHIACRCYTEGSPQVDPVAAWLACFDLTPSYSFVTVVCEAKRGGRCYVSLATTRLAVPCSAALTDTAGKRRRKRKRKREGERERGRGRERERERERESESESERARERESERARERERKKERGRYSSSIVNSVGWYLRSLWSGCTRLSRSGAAKLWQRVNSFSSRCVFPFRYVH